MKQATFWKSWTRSSEKFEKALKNSKYSLVTPEEILTAFFGKTLLGKTEEVKQKEQKKKLTDTCSVFTACNEDIYLVVGDALNFKITTDSDLKMANALAELSEK